MQNGQNYGFGILDVTWDSLSWRFIGTSGEVIDTFTLTRS